MSDAAARARAFRFKDSRVGSLRPFDGHGPTYVAHTSLAHRVLDEFVAAGLADVLAESFGEREQQQEESAPVQVSADEMGDDAPEED